MKIFVILLLFSQTTFLMAQGVKFDSEIYNAAPSYEPSTMQGFSNSTSFPSKVSYRSYCPPIQSQGELSTCVGWATYSLLSTQQNILMGETDVYKKTIRVMDPHFVYAFIRNFNDLWCQEGVYMVDAMETILKYGSKPLLTPPWLTCNSTTEFNKFALAIASIYSVNNYYNLKDTSDLINTLKYVLNDKKPIAVGLNVTKSFSTGTGVKYGKWSPNSYEQIEGGHAMCIVGYDDSKYGGSFELMNSYGTDFGDNGFVWISYSDMKKYLKEAFFIELNTGDYGYRAGNCTLGDCDNYYSRYKYSNGEIYEGEYTNGYCNGWGMYLHANNSFYIGEFSNGYKHGWGITFDYPTSQYYKTSYNNGILQSSEYYQGFSGCQEDAYLNELIDNLQTLIPGIIVDINSEEYQEILEKSEPEGEPVKTN